MNKYKQHRNKLSQVASAAKAGISERSARRIEDAQNLPSQRPTRSCRTREDPLSAVLDSDVIPLLQTDARLNAVTLLEELQRRYPQQRFAVKYPRQEPYVRIGSIGPLIHRLLFVQTE